MKHLNYFLLVVGVCLLAQCAQPDPAEIPEPALPADPAVESFGITPEDAAAEALAAREALSPATRAQAVAVRSVVRHGAQTAVQSAETVDPSFYVVNFEQESGFAIVAADRRQQATVYAISDEGALPDPASIGEESPLNLIYARIEQLASAPTDMRQQGAVVVTNWKTIKTVGPYVKVCWGMEYPYRQSAFNVALCQIMSYHQWPTTYRWGVINQYLGRYFQPSSDPVLLSAASQLFRTVDEKIEGAGSTEQAFSRVGYLCDAEKPYKMSTVYDQIDLKRPVFAFGQERVGCVVYAYPWVMDGYLLQSRSTSAYPGIETRTLIHCNLGNDGYGNGYYLSALFDLNDPEYKDNPTWPDGWAQGQNSFDANHIGIITNIRPNRLLISNPDLTITLKPGILDSAVFVRP